MELFRLLGTVAVENDEANEALDETTEKAEKSHSKIAGAFAKIGSAAIELGKVIAVGLAAASVAVVGITKSAVSSYADYEQLVGGVETLFKDSADTVLEYAKNAYKTAGMSANEYMETVTGFSASLLQSLNGDTQKAAESADMAIKDMSDNANKMGTSMEAIQNAYSGFSKQNYTMLDNLKLGYGGTKEEMERLLADAEKLSGVHYDISNLSDVYEAIHVVQTEMGITGTTAKEAASTISGSVATMKSSWQNLLAGLGSGENVGDLVNQLFESIDTVGTNLLPRIQQILLEISEAITAAAPMIAEKLPKLLSDTLPGLITAAASILNALIPAIVKMLPKVLSALIDGIMQVLPTLLPTVIEGLVDLISAIAEAIPEIIPPLLEALPIVLDTICEGLIELLPVLLDGAVQLFMGIVNAIPIIIERLVPEIPRIVQTIVDSLIANLPIIIAGLIQLALAIVQATPQIIQTLLPMLPVIIESIVNGLLENTPLMLAGAIELFGALLEALLTVGAEIGEAIPEILMAILSGFEPLIEELGFIVDTCWENIQISLSGVGEFFSGMWTNIQNIFSNVGTWFNDQFTKAWNNIKKVFAPWGTFFKGLWDMITKLFGKVGTTIADAISGAVKSAVNTVLKGAIKIINGFISALNAAISVINAIPGVKISKLDKLDTPQLEKGGVLEKGQVGILEGNGAEAVVPLEKNREWIARVSDEMQNQGIGGGSETIGIMKEILSMLQALKEGSENLPEVLTDAMADGLKFDIDNREFARMVKAV